MSYVLYFSNYCNNSKNIMNKIIKDYQNPSDIHWACIDNRTKEGNNTYILLKNGTKLLMPDIINRVPALLSLIDYKTPTHNNPHPQQQQQPQHFQNDEPEAFSLGNSINLNNNVLSDQYSAWNLDSDQLSAKGEGGILQMHNYVNVNYKDNITTSIPSEKISRQPRMSESMTIENLQKKRDLDMSTIRK